MSCFHLPINDAAKQLGTCVTVLKKQCRRHGVKRWPYRKLVSIDKLIEKMEKEQTTADDKEYYQHELHTLHQRKEHIFRSAGNVAAATPSRAAKGTSSATSDGAQTPSSPAAQSRADGSAALDATPALRDPAYALSTAGAPFGVRGAPLPQPQAAAAAAAAAAATQQQRMAAASFEQLPFPLGGMDAPLYPGAPAVGQPPPPPPYPGFPFGMPFGPGGYPLPPPPGGVMPGGPPPPLPPTPSSRPPGSFPVPVCVMYGCECFSTGVPTSQMHFLSSMPFAPPPPPIMPPVDGFGGAFRPPGAAPGAPGAPLKADTPATGSGGVTQRLPATSGAPAAAASSSAAPTPPPPPPPPPPGVRNFPVYGDPRAYPFHYGAGPAGVPPAFGAGTLGGAGAGALPPPWMAGGAAARGAAAGGGEASTTPHAGGPAGAPPLTPKTPTGGGGGGGGGGGVVVGDGVDADARGGGGVGPPPSARRPMRTGMASGSASDHTSTPRLGNTPARLAGGGARAAPRREPSGEEQLHSGSGRGGDGSGGGGVVADRTAGGAAARQVPLPTAVGRRGTPGGLVGPGDRIGDRRRGLAESPHGEDPPNESAELRRGARQPASQEEGDGAGRRAGGSGVGVGVAGSVGGGGGGSGSGSGSGSNMELGSGSGSASGDGNGSGDGTGSGDGNGSGDGSGSGDGNGSGSGTGMGGDGGSGAEAPDAARHAAAARMLPRHRSSKSPADTAASDTGMDAAMSTVPPVVKPGVRPSAPVEPAGRDAPSSSAAAAAAAADGGGSGVVQPPAAPASAPPSAAGAAAHKRPRNASRHADAYFPHRAGSTEATGMAAAASATGRFRGTPTGSGVGHAGGGSAIGAGGSGAVGMDGAEAARQSGHDTGGSVQGSGSGSRAMFVRGDSPPVAVGRPLAGPAGATTHGSPHIGNSGRGAAAHGRHHHHHHHHHHVLRVGASGRPVGPGGVVVGGGGGVVDGGGHRISSGGTPLGSGGGGGGGRVFGSLSAAAAADAAASAAATAAAARRVAAKRAERSSDRDDAGEDGSGDGGSGAGDSADLPPAKRTRKSTTPPSGDAGTSGSDVCDRRGAVLGGGCDGGGGSGGPGGRAGVAGAKGATSNVGRERPQVVAALGAATGKRLLPPSQPPLHGEGSNGSSSSASGSSRSVAARRVERTTSACTALRLALWTASRGLVVTLATGDASLLRCVGVPAVGEAIPLSHRLPADVVGGGRGGSGGSSGGSGSDGGTGSGGDGGGRPGGAPATVGSSSRLSHLRPIGLQPQSYARAVAGERVEWTFEAGDRRFLQVLTPVRGDRGDVCALSGMCVELCAGAEGGHAADGDMVVAA